MSDIDEHYGKAEGWAESAVLAENRDYHEEALACAAIAQVYATLALVVTTGHLTSRPL